MADPALPTAASRHPLAGEAQTAFLAAVGNVDPTKLVKAAVRQGRLDDWLGDLEDPNWITVLALGKAAPRMLWGLVEAGVPLRGLGVTPRGVRAPQVDTFRWLPGNHPVPGEDSFAAGVEVLAWVDELPPDQPVLCLLSGGASACVEHPADGVSPEELQARWRDLLRAGKPIGDMNRERTAWSALKGGRLGARLLERTSRVRCWILADTPPDAAPQTVGSAPLWQPDGTIPHHVLASNDELVQQAGLHLGAAGWTVYRHTHRVEGDAEAEVAAFLDAFHALKGENVALVGGGEPTVALPADAPPGGRCRHAALLAARHLTGHGSQGVFLAGASDGVDGSRGASGAWADAAAWDADPEGANRALAGFDAAGWLERAGRAFDLGPTGTNVNDLWVALRR